MKELTIKMQDALADAHEQATRAGHAQIDAVHLLLALLKQPEGIVSPVLEKLGLGAGSMGRGKRETTGEITP